MIDFTYLNNPTLYVGLLKHLHLLTCIEDLKQSPECLKVVMLKFYNIPNILTLTFKLSKETLPNIKRLLTCLGIKLHLTGA